MWFEHYLNNAFTEAILWGGFWHPDNSGPTHRPDRFADNDCENVRIYRQKAMELLVMSERMINAIIKQKKSSKKQPTAAAAPARPVVAAPARPAVAPKQVPGKQINIFSTPKKKYKTASYIYSKNPNGQHFFAFARKVPMGARIRITGGPNPNTGAAGTSQKYWGKWGSFGGSMGRNVTNYLHAAIDEINDEGGINPKFSRRDDVYVPWVKLIKNSGAKLNLQMARLHDGVVIFIFEMPDFNNFIKLFPHFPIKRGGANIVTSSHGEIDFVSSFTYDDMVKYQSIELIKNNNFFMSYVLNSFNLFVIPKLLKLSNGYFNKKEIRFISDKKNRIVNPIPTYTEYARGKYR